jgi:hypothetical protein
MTQRDWMPKGHIRISFCMEFLCLYLYVIYLSLGEDTFDRDDVRRSQQVDVYMFIVCVLPPTTELFQLDS